MRRGRTGSRVDDLEADFLARLRAVEAVCAVDFGDVLGLCEGDVCALSSHVSQFIDSSCSVAVRERGTHVVQRCAVLRHLDDLNSRVVADLGRVVCGQRHLREAEGAVVLLVGWTGDLEDGDGVVRVVEGFVAVAEVDVELRVGVAWEPAWLDGYGAAFQWPFCAVLRCAHATAWDGISYCPNRVMLWLDYYVHGYIHCIP
jgi:hypothetical protein